MSQKFYTLITQQGAALLANATALGIPLKLCKMAVGDANGSATTPDASQTKLIHEVFNLDLIDLSEITKEVINFLSPNSNDANKESLTE